MGDYNIGVRIVVFLYTLLEDEDMTDEIEKYSASEIIKIDDFV